MPASSQKQPHLHAMSSLITGEDGEEGRHSVDESSKVREDGRHGQPYVSE